MSGMGSRSGNGEDGNVPGRQASEEKGIGSSCAELGPEETERRTGRPRGWESGSVDAAGRRSAAARWSGRLAGCGRRR